MKLALFDRYCNFNQCLITCLKNCKLSWTKKEHHVPSQRIIAAVTRIRTWVTSATTKGTNHYTITAIRGDIVCNKRSNDITSIQN